LVNAAGNLGVKMTDIYWTMGALGNIRTQTLRAFSAKEMNRILEKVPAGNFVAAK